MSTPTAGFGLPLSSQFPVQSSVSMATDAGMGDKDLEMDINEHQGDQADMALDIEDSDDGQENDFGTNWKRFSGGVKVLEHQESSEAFLKVTTKLPDVKVVRTDAALCRHAKTLGVCSIGLNDLSHPSIMACIQRAQTFTTRFYGPNANPASDNWEGYLEIYFPRTEDAQRFTDVMKDLRGDVKVFICTGKERVTNLKEWHQSRGSGRDALHEGLVFIEALPEQATETDLWQIFQGASEVFIPIDRMNKSQRKGYAYVYYADHAKMEAAVDLNNETELHGQKLCVRTYQQCRKLKQSMMQFPPIMKEHAGPLKLQQRLKYRKKIKSLQEELSNEDTDRDEAEVELIRARLANLQKVMEEDEHARDELKKEKAAEAALAKLQAQNTPAAPSQQQQHQHQQQQQLRQQQQLQLAASVLQAQQPVTPARSMSSMSGQMPAQAAALQILAQSLGLTGVQGLNMGAATPLQQSLAAPGQAAPQERKLSKASRQRQKKKAMKQAAAQAQPAEQANDSTMDIKPPVSDLVQEQWSPDVSGGSNALLAAQLKLSNMAQATSHTQPTAGPSASNYQDQKLSIGQKKRRRKQLKRVQAAGSGGDDNPFLQDTMDSQDLMGTMQGQSYQPAMQGAAGFGAGPNQQNYVNNALVQLALGQLLGKDKSSNETGGRNKKQPQRSQGGRGRGGGGRGRGRFWNHRKGNNRNQGQNSQQEQGGDDHWAPPQSQADGFGEKRKFSYDDYQGADAPEKKWRPNDPYY